MSRIMSEQTFPEPLSDERFAALGKQLDPCLDVRNGTWRRSSLSKDRLRLICEFEAPDAQSVRDAHRAANVAFDSIYAADVFAVEDYPEMMNKLRALLERNSPKA